MEKASEAKAAEDAQAPDLRETVTTADPLQTWTYTPKTPPGPGRNFLIYGDGRVVELTDA